MHFMNLNEKMKLSQLSQLIWGGTCMSTYRPAQSFRNCTKLFANFLNCRQSCSTFFSYHKHTCSEKITSTIYLDY